MYIWETVDEDPFLPLGTVTSYVPLNVCLILQVCVCACQCVCVCVCVQKTDWAVLLHGPIIMITHVVCKILHLHTHTHTYTALINQCQMCVLHFALHLWVFYSWKLLRTRKYAQNLKPFLDLERIRNAILWILWKWLSTLFLLDLFFFYVKRLF